MYQKNKNVRVNASRHLELHTGALASEHSCTQCNDNEILVVWRRERAFGFISDVRKHLPSNWILCDSSVAMSMYSKPNTFRIFKRSHTFSILPKYFVHWVAWLMPACVCPRARSHLFVCVYALSTCSDCIFSWPIK